MHYYACPHCDPDEKAHLFETTIEVQKCEHKKGLFSSDKKCKKEKYKCKKRGILKCHKCKSEFLPSKKFRQEQKRKIKDG